MLALGLLFMIVAAAVTAGAIYDGGESAEFEVFGQTIGTTVGGVFVAGLATMLLFFVGVWMLMKSLARSRRKRIERKETKTRQRESVSKIEEERAQLRAENEALQERLARERGTDLRRCDGRHDGRQAERRHTGTTGTTGATSTPDSAAERPTDTTSARPTGTGRAPGHRPDLAAGGRRLRSSPRRLTARHHLTSLHRTGPGPRPGRWHVQPRHDPGDRELDDDQHRPSASTSQAATTAPTRGRPAPPPGTVARPLWRPRGPPPGPPGPRSAPARCRATTPHPDQRRRRRRQHDERDPDRQQPGRPAVAATAPRSPARHGHAPRRRRPPGRRPRPPARPATTGPAAAPWSAPRPPPGRPPG